MPLELSDRERAISLYRTALQGLMDESRNQRFGDVVTIIQEWLNELSPEICDDDLCSHAKRTIRALGGMGGLGDVARTEATKTYFEFINRVYRTAKGILDSCDDSFHSG
jgi:hypothetical protein